MSTLLFFAHSLLSQGPSALRNELAAAKKAVEVLKGEKDHTQQKLEKLHAVLEKERAALRDVLSAARKAVDDLKVTLPSPIL